MSESHVAAGQFPAAPRERRDLVRRPMCDAVARWFQLHPSALAPLDHQTVTRMASRVGVTTVAHPRSRTSSAILEIDGFLMDRQRRTAHAGDREVSLTPTEFELLLLLLSRTDALHSSAELTRRLWGSDADRHRRSLFVYIRRLRAKLEPGHVPFRITTVFGRGYRIDRRLR